MTTQIKPGVSLIGITPQTVLGMVCTSSIAQSMGVDCVMTSGTEGRHSNTSLHYAGNAFDCRIRHLSPSQRVEFAKRVSEALGLPYSEFDVVLEDTHLHVEWQPKRPLRS